MDCDKETGANLAMAHHSDGVGAGLFLVQAVSRRHLRGRLEEWAYHGDALRLHH